MIANARKTGGSPSPRGSTNEEYSVITHKPAGGYILANGVDRATADELRKDNEGAVVNRNADGTYRVTKTR